MALFQILLRYLEHVTHPLYKNQWINPEQMFMYRDARVSLSHRLQRGDRMTLSSSNVRIAWGCVWAKSAKILLLLFSCSYLVSQVYTKTNKQNQVYFVSNRSASQHATRYTYERQLPLPMVLAVVISVISHFFSYCWPSSHPCPFWLHLPYFGLQPSHSWYLAKKIRSIWTWHPSSCSMEHLYHILHLPFLPLGCPMLRIAPEAMDLDWEVPFLEALLVLFQR